MVACVGAATNADNLSRGRTLARNPGRQRQAGATKGPACGNVDVERSGREGGRLGEVVRAVKMPCCGLDSCSGASLDSRRGRRPRHRVFRLLLVRPVCLEG